jgi:hypothetical protein
MLAVKNITDGEKTQRRPIASAYIIDYTTLITKLAHLSDPVLVRQVSRSMCTD